MHIFCWFFWILLCCRYSYMVIYNKRVPVISIFSTSLHWSTKGSLAKPAIIVDFAEQYRDNLWKEPLEGKDDCFDVDWNVSPVRVFKFIRYLLYTEILEKYGIVNFYARVFRTPRASHARLLTLTRELLFQPTEQPNPFLEKYFLNSIRLEYGFIVLKEFFHESHPQRWNLDCHRAERLLLCSALMTSLIVFPISQ